MKNKTTVLLGVIVVILALIASSLAIYYLFFNQTVKMIDMSNMNVEEVREFFTKNNVKEDNYELKFEYSETIEKDKVISQSLEAGKEIKKDDIVLIEISNGKDPNLEVEIIDFSDKTEEEIKSWFDTNLFTDVTYEYVISEKEKGKFVSLNVDNKIQKRSALIVVSISAGKDAVGIEIELPDFKDYTKTNIQAWAKSNNITVSFKNEASKSVKEGKVISQNPAGGTKIKTGDKISVTLSSGNGITATNFAGKKKADAEKWIKQNGLKANYTNIYDGKIAEGLIVSNKPNSGSIKAGSTVQFNVSIGLVPVDDYTNKTKDAFNTYIGKLNASNNKSANIKVSIVEEESVKAAGTIISQLINNKQVSGQSKVAPGTTVTIKVAKTRSIKVDSKTGVNENDFKKYITDLGLKLGNRTERYDDNKAGGIIISNDTGNYSSGNLINYTVSIGKFTINLAAYNNKPYNDIVNAINNANSKGAGYSVNKTEDASTTVSKGNIISCTQSGKNVSCKVSSGAPITVDNYVGGIKPCIDKCKAAGKDINLVITYEFSNDVDKDKVIRQSIAPNTVVAPGTTVTLTVSKGKVPEPKIKVPNYVGGNNPCGEANSCNVNDLNITITKENHDTVESGKVISQSIPGGSEVDKGTTVNIIVSLGKKISMCPVNQKIKPNHNAGSYSETVAEVKELLKNFTVNIITLSGENDNPDGMDGDIKNVTPLASELECGTTITVEIYKKD